MEVKNIDIKSIQPYERNAKKHPPEQVDNIAKSIEKFGWAQPLVIDRDGTIVIGHGRYEAAKKLELSEVPCVIADDLTEDDLKALRLIDNKLNESDWNFDLLEEELNGLDFGSFDLDWGLELPPPNLDAFFEDAEQKEKEPKMITCPHCGNTFEAP